MIKAVVFDYGGVIEINESGNVLNVIAQLINIPMPTLRNEYQKYNHLHNVENWQWNDVIVKVVSTFDPSEKMKQQVLSLMENHYLKRKINLELLNLFPILKNQGLKVAIFSNNNLKLRKDVEKNGILKLVDELVVSAEIGHQKPHKEAFRILFEKLKLVPQEVIFIDDTPRSLEKAGEIGYVPILFKNNDQLKDELRKMGMFVG